MPKAEPNGSGAGSSAPSSAVVLDAAHLARQTFGDASLAREVLDLFAQQLKTLRTRLSDARQSREALHALKGSASSVGAFAVASLAASLENRALSADDLSTLDGMIAKTLAAVARHGR